MPTRFDVPPHIATIKPYCPGKPVEALEREYGIKNSIKLASNENPLGPSPMAVEAVRAALTKLNRYPDGSGHDLIGKLSDFLKVSPGRIVLGNGSDEIIILLARVLLPPGSEAIIPRSSFSMYDISVRSCNAVPVYTPLDHISIDLEKIAEAVTSATRIIFLCNPNNPTGTIIRKSDFDRFLMDIPSDVVIVLDEAYAEFVRDSDCACGPDYLDSGKNIVFLRTFSKVYGIAGLRIGYGVMPEHLAELLNRIRPPFNTGSLAQAGAAAALEDKDFLKKSIRLVHDELDFLYASLDKMGIAYFPTQTNFFLIDVGKNAQSVYEDLLRKGVIVRSMLSYGYSEYIRVSVGRREENIRFLKALETVLK